MVIKYEVIPKSLYLFFINFFYFTTFEAILFYVATFFVKIKSISLYVYGFIAFVLIVFLFWYSLHKNYYRANKGDIFICDFDNKSMSYTHNGNNIQFNANEIQSITHYMSYPLKNNKWGFLAWDRYSYMDIKLADGRSIVITNILIEKLKNFPPMMKMSRDIITEVPSFYFRKVRR